MTAEQSPRDRLVFHVRRLERLEVLKAEAATAMKEALSVAKRSGFDPGTLMVVLRLRKMTPELRREKRALEAIYLAALGMLEGDPLPDEARRRLNGEPEAPPPAKRTDASQPAIPRAPEGKAAAAPPAPPPPPKDPAAARQEGSDAAVAGKRIFDNPYPAGDPCRAAWDEGWCAQRKSHGMDPPAAYQRRTKKPPPKDDDGSNSKDADGAEKGDGDEASRD